MLRKLRNTMARLFLALSLLIAGCLTFAPAAGADDAFPNLLTNPGFEMPPEEDGSIPGWHVRPLNGGNEVNLIDHMSSEGLYSLQVKDVASTASVIVYSDPIEVSPGQSFHLLLKANDSSGTITAAVRQYRSADDDPVGGYISPQSSVRIPAAQQWTQLQVDGQIHEEANYARVMIYTVIASTGAAVLDDLYFTVTDESGGGIAYEEVNLGSFVHNINVFRAVFHEDESGKTIAYATLEGAPNKLLVIDTDTGNVLKELLVKDTVGGTEYLGNYLRGLAIAPDGTVYMAGTPSLLFKYVPGEDRVQFVTRLPGSATFDLKYGPDGILVGGTYNRNEAFEYNTQTGELVNLGRVTEEEAYVYSVAYDEARNDYYFGIGSHAHLFRYDRDTGTKTEIPLPERFSDAQFVWDLAVVEDKLFMRFSPGRTLAMNLITGEFEETDAAVTSRLVSPKAPDENRVYFTASSELGYYDFGSGQYTMLSIDTENDANSFAFARLSDPDFPGSSLVGVMEGWLFHYNPATGNSKKIRIPVTGQPAVLQTVAKGIDGRMHTSGYLSGGNAIFDPLTGQREEYTKETVGKFQVVPGSQTDRIYSYKDKIYYVTYGNMRVYEYDQSMPWDRQHPQHPNPRFLFTASDVGMQDRGLAGTLIEEAGKLVIGTVPKYGYLGGALVIYDLEKDEREVYWNIVPNQSVTAVAYKDGFIYGGSNIWGGLGANPTESEAKLFIWDMDKKEKVFETVPIAGKRGITELIVGPDGMIWGSAEGDLFIFDPETRQVVHRQTLVSRSYGSAVWRDAQFEIGTDGNVYGVQANQFFVIDAQTKKKTVIRNAGKRNWLGQDDFGRFYLTEETELLQITIPELLLRPIGARLDVPETNLTRGETVDVTVAGLLEKGRTIQRLDKRNPEYYSSDPSVVRIENGRLTAANGGTAEVWAQVMIDGQTFETNRVAITVTVTPETLEHELNSYIEAGNIQNAMASQLSNSLRQARHFLALNKQDQALHHLENFQKHLLNPALAAQIDPQAKAVLAADVEQLIQNIGGSDQE